MVERFGRRRCLAGDLEARMLGQDLLEADADDIVVVDDQDGERLGRWQRRAGFVRGGR